MILRNHYTHVHVYCIERSVNISITRITRVNNICFVMLLLVMIYLHMLIFRLMVTMVVEVLLISHPHSFLGERTINSKFNEKIIPLFPSTY